ncbi:MULTISPECIES: porin [unclassified Erwinia]|uniref:porin n=1 Tax=unclassified Erwinia TaxID=2622719 RepID=UPI000C77B47B|nr:MULTISPECIES: porin [unclassified Erwinia]PLV58599.1 membrane protein [Erwinia sp. B116]
MMKRSLLAVLLPVLLASTAAQASEIYNKDGNKLDLNGKINVGHLFSDDASNDGDVSYARFGFKGETQINQYLTGYGQWQYNFQLNKSEGSDALSGDKTRLGFAGLKFGKFGSFDYGRNYGLVYDTLAFTDVLPKFGGDSGFSDVFLSSRSTGVATYRNKDFFGLVDGLNFGLQYEGKNERTGTDAVRRSNGDGFALTASYTSDFGLGAVASYASIKRLAVQNAAPRGDGDRAEHWATGVKYDANQVYVATIYGNTHNATPIGGGFANKAVNFEAVAQYQFLNGFRPSLAYVTSKGKDIEGIGDADIVKYASLGAYYYFNKNFNAYAEYKFNLLKDNNALALKTDDVSGVGLNYQF